MYSANPVPSAVYSKLYMLVIQIFCIFRRLYLIILHLISFLTKFLLASRNFNKHDKGIFTTAVVYVSYRHVVMSLNEWVPGPGRSQHFLVTLPLQHPLQVRVGLRVRRKNFLRGTMIKINHIHHNHEQNTDKQTEERGLTTVHGAVISHIIVSL